VGRRCAVVGGINMDIQGRSERRFRPADSNPGAAILSPGGVGRNIAENLVRLGLEVELVTVLGDDPLSRGLEESCAALGIGLAGALRLGDRPASLYICLLDSDGSLAGAVASMENIDSLLPEALADRSAILDKAELIVVDANLPEASIRWIARRYGVRQGGRSRPALVLDPVSVAKAPRAVSSLWAFDIAKPNRGEAAVIAAGLGASGPPPMADASLYPTTSIGLSPSVDGPSPRELASRIRATGLREVFISIGRDGILYDGAESGIARPPPELPDSLRPVNVSGAGDAACAALAWGHLEGFGTAKKARHALAAAMLTAASETTVTPLMSAKALSEIAEGVCYEPLP
jgi:pseudouridine kinase